MVSGFRKKRVTNMVSGWRGAGVKNYQLSKPGNLEKLVFLWAPTGT
jgi:hypothetical protein